MGRGCDGMGLQWDGDTVGWGCGGMMQRDGDAVGMMQWDGDAVGRDHRSQSHQTPPILPAGCLPMLV